MGIQLASSFDMNAALPLDSRSTVANITARDAIASGRRYEGLIVYVESEQTNYQLVGGITNTDWTELSGSGTGGGGSSASGAETLANNAVTNITAIGDYLSNARAIVVDYYLYRRVSGTNKRMSGRLVLEGVNDAVLNADKWQLAEIIRSEFGGASGVTFSLDAVDTEKSILVATLDDFAGASHECVFYYRTTKLLTTSDVATLTNNASTNITDIGAYLVDARAIFVDYYLYRRTDSEFRMISGKLILEGVNDGATNSDKWQLLELERSEALGSAGVTFSLDDIDTEKSVLTITLDNNAGANHDCKFYYKKSVLTV
jgi:hypothetical protein